MITNFFSKTKPINFLVLSAMIIVVFLISSVFTFDSQLSLTYLVKKGIFLLIVTFMLFVLDFVIRKNTLTHDNSYALLIYVFLWGFFPFSFENSDFLISNLFLLLSFRKIYSLRTQIKTKEKIFDSALWISIACIFYSWSILYLILLYAAIFLFNKSSRRNLIIPLIGFVTPIFLLYVYLLIVDNLEIIGLFWELQVNFDLSNYSQNNILIPLILILLFSTISIFATTKQSIMSNQDFKSTWIILIFQLALSIVVVLIAPSKNGSELSFLFFPLSILFANYIQDVKKYWLKELFLYLFIVVFFTAYLV